MKQFFKKLVFFPIYFWRLPKPQLVYQGANIKSASDIDVVLVVASDGRYKVLSKVIREFLAIGSVGLTRAVVVVLTDERDINALKSLDDIASELLIVKCSNVPLGNKWQCAVDAAKILSPKTILISGSDDVIHRQYILSAYDEVQTHQRTDFYATSSWFVRDRVGRYFQVEFSASVKPSCLGAGRMYSSKLLDRFGWQLFDRYFNSGLDILGFIRGTKYSKKKPCLHSKNGFVLSVKGDWDMLNPMKVLKRSKRLIVKELTPSASDDLSRFEWISYEDIDCC